MPVMIEEIIKKQTISILDAVLSAQSQQNADLNQPTIQKDKVFTPQQYTSVYLQKGIIKEDQTQILVALIQQYLQSQNQNNQFQNQPLTFTYDDAYSMLKSIKRDLLKEGPTKKTQKIDDFQIKQLQSGHKRNQTPLKNPHDYEQSLNLISFDQGPKNTHRSRRQQSGQEQTDKELGQMSKKLKKQNQFIARNIDRIKKYATNFSDAILPLERSQLQQVKISHEISHKLFHLYRPIYPSGMSNNKQVEMNNFETKEQYKSTLNYHKILEMFIDAPTKLEIQNKLSLLRIIKKFAFNPNFIQLQEWTKIYRAIINNLGFKQILLQRLVKTKEQEKRHNKLPSIVMASKQKPQKTEYRSRRIKTQVSIPEHRLTSLNNIDNITNQYQSQKNIQYMSNKSSIRPIEQQQKNQLKSYNPNEYRSRHKKLLTDVSEVFLKNVKKDMRSEKMIGLEDKKQDKNGSQVLHESGKNQYSYLKKAIKCKKIGKITWESLFDMNEDTMYHNIVIPQFAKLLDQENN